MVGKMVKVKEYKFPGFFSIFYFIFYLHLFKFFLLYLIYKLRDTENRLVVAKVEEEGVGGIDWEVGGGRCKLLQLEWRSNEIVLHSTVNYI